MLTLLSVAIIVALFFGPIVEMLALSAFAGLFLQDKFYAGPFPGKPHELAIWTFLISMVVLYAIYKSRGGAVLSILFSLFWSILIGGSIYSSGASICSCVVGGVAAFSFFVLLPRMQMRSCHVQKVIGRTKAT